MKLNCIVNEVNRMCVVMVFVWGFLLMNMVVYVIFVMMGGIYSFVIVFIFGVVFMLVVILIGELGVLNKLVNNYY